MSAVSADQGVRRRALNVKAMSSAVLTNAGRSGALIAHATGTSHGTHVRGSAA
ncbi:hypothetical protein ACFVT5_25995 [Streptomyces sp. NPDC058001]|uniref:hypothetical protein n=1 Tax=Streptomyces sp. NPDC058001 TaxID=3346300 RepID=UPI0036F0C7CF